MNQANGTPAAIAWLIIAWACRGLLTGRPRIRTSPPGITPAARDRRAGPGCVPARGIWLRLAEAASLRYARLVLQLPDSGEELEMDLLKEALEPRWVTVQITPAASVRAVSLEDTVGLKARA